MTFPGDARRWYWARDEAGIFTLTVSATASNHPVLTKNYPFNVSLGAVLPPHSSVDTSASPINGGTTTGDGVYTNGTTATVTAAPAIGFAFVNWTDNGTVVSNAPSSYTFTNLINRSLVANFVPVPQLSFAAQPARTLALTWPTNFSGFQLQRNADASTTNWSNATNVVSIVGTNYQATDATAPGTRYFRLKQP